MSKLTPKERQVLQLAAGGATNAEIAMALNITKQTVKNHLHAIGKTYGTSGRVESIMLGIINGDVMLNVAIEDVKARIPDK